MPTFRTQTILKSDNGIAADFITNTMAWVTAAPFGVTTDYTAAIKDFYDDITAQLSSDVAQNGHEIKYYDLPGPGAPNYPVAMDTFNLSTNPTGSPLPSEVSVVCSFQAPKTPGLPQSRRRGRIYIGPLNTGINSAGRPGGSNLSSIASAMQTLQANMVAAAVPAELAVWSSVDQAAVICTDGWLDNAFDTQRRRGVSASSRTTFNF